MPNKFQAVEFKPQDPTDERRRRLEFIAWGVYSSLGALATVSEVGPGELRIDIKDTSWKLALDEDGRVKLSGFPQNKNVTQHVGRLNPKKLEESVAQVVEQASGMIVKSLESKKSPKPPLYLPSAEDRLGEPTHKSEKGTTENEDKEGGIGNPVPEGGEDMGDTGIETPPVSCQTPDMGLSQAPPMAPPQPTTPQAPPVPLPTGSRFKRVVQELDAIATDLANRGRRSAAKKLAIVANTIEYGFRKAANWPTDQDIDMAGEQLNTAVGDEQDLEGVIQYAQSLDNPQDLINLLHYLVREGNPASEEVENLVHEKVVFSGPFGGSPGTEIE